MAETVGLVTDYSCFFQLQKSHESHAERHAKQGKRPEISICKTDSVDSEACTEGSRKQVQSKSTGCVYDPYTGG